MSLPVEQINAHHARLKSLFDEYVPRLLAARKSNDQVSAAVPVYETLCRLGDAIKSYRDDLKRSIRDDMIATGTVESEAGPYIVSLRQGATRAVVTNDEELRRTAPDVFEPQPDKINSSALAKLLKFKTVQGAELIRGEPTIVIKGKIK